MSCLCLERSVAWTAKGGWVKAAEFELCLYAQSCIIVQSQQSLFQIRSFIQMTNYKQTSKKSKVAACYNRPKMKERLENIKHHVDII